MAQVAKHLPSKHKFEFQYYRKREKGTRERERKNNNPAVFIPNLKKKKKLIKEAKNK
jgi:hypothetical protein